MSPKLLFHERKDELYFLVACNRGIVDTLVNLKTCTSHYNTDTRTCTQASNPYFPFGLEKDSIQFVPATRTDEISMYRPIVVCHMKP